jgi:hypothetical protein
MGGVGRLLGWTPLLRNMVRGKALGDLRAFMGEQPGAGR